MTVRWLSGDWLEAAMGGWDDVTGPPELTGTVEVVVGGGPDGDAVAHLVFDGGRRVGGGCGAAPSPDVTLSLSDPDAREVLAGRLEPSVAFMQGRMKVSGSMAPVLELLVLAGTDEARGRRSRLAEATVFP